MAVLGLLKVICNQVCDDICAFQIALLLNNLQANPWVVKIPWSKKWQAAPVFLPGKFQGQRSLAGYSPWGSKRVGHGLVTKTITNIHSMDILYT